MRSGALAGLPPDMQRTETTPITPRHSPLKPVAPSDAGRRTGTDTAAAGPCSASRCAAAGALSES